MTEDEIINYYNQAHGDYRLVWNIDKTLSMHYGFYDKTNQNHADAVTNMNNILSRIARVKSKDRVLDAGCGVGGSSIWLAKNIGSKVVGININKKQVEIAS